MKKLFLIAKGVVMLLGFATAIGLVMSLFVFAFADSRLEWVGEDGLGNGFAHEICDGKGWPIAHLRLSDYSSENKAYLLKIRYTGLCDVRKTITAIRSNPGGFTVAEGCFNLRNRNRFDAEILEMPVEFTPEVVGETLILNFSIRTEYGDIKEIRLQFKSKKVFHQLSI